MEGRKVKLNKLIKSRTKKFENLCNSQAITLLRTLKRKNKVGGKQVPLEWH